MDDRSGMTADTAHRALFAAIEEGRFERVGDLAAKYKHSVVRYLADAEIQETIAPLSDILKPLYAARDLLRIIREHQSAQFQKLAMGSLYRFPAPPAKGKTFDVNA